MSIIRTRWAAIGAAVAVTLGAGGIGIVSATQPSVAVAFVPITPCRVMDTRTEFNVGPKSSPLGSGETYTVETTTGDTGNCTDIPTTATGVSLNVTALDATMPTFLTVWATGDAQPQASSLNPVPGQPPTPNAVTTGVDTNGQFDIYNLQGDVDVIADINGYYTDHHHDDRYYTKTQTDSAITAAIAGTAESVGDVIALGFVNAATPEFLETRVAPGISLEVSDPQVGRIDIRVIGADTDDAPIVQITPHSPQGLVRTCATRTLAVNGPDDYTVRIECRDGGGLAATTSFQFVIVG